MHNGGTYTLLKDGGTWLEAQRKTPNGQYIDVLDLNFVPATGGKCLVYGCSESQAYSVYDYSTNFCNIKVPIPTVSFTPQEAERTPPGASTDLPRRKRS